MFPQHLLQLHPGFVGGIQSGIQTVEYFPKKWGMT